ncbi:MAG TPA: hypothetical protein PLB62_00090 [Candidatus Sumerlaeota bacterium]|nr:hypothetical protein [Candidatus Sumerlaeota bacterium]
MTLPPVLLLTEMYLHRKKILIPGGMEASDPAGWKRAIRDATIRILPFAAVFILYMNVRLRVLGFVGIKETEWYFAGLSAAVRLSAMCAGFLVYLRLLLFPVGMSHDYNLPVRVWGPFWAELPQSFLNGWALAGLAAFLLILGWSLRAAWRGRPEGYGIVLFFVTMFPFSNIMPFGDFIAERFLYLPSAGVCLAGGVLLARFGKQPGRSRLALAILVAIVAGYSVRTILRNRDWKSGVTIWESELRHNSRNPNLYTGLGAEYGVERGEHLGRGNIYRARGDYKNAAAHLELAMEYEKKALDVLALAIEKNPRDYWTYYNYGGLATEMREPDTVLAEEILLKGAACMPENLRSLHVFYYYLGMIHLKRKPPNMDMALEFFRKAHRLKRSDRRIKNTLAAALGEVGRYDEAIALTRSILKEQPHNREAVKNLRLLRAAVLRRQVTPGPVFPDRL